MTVALQQQQIDRDVAYAWRTCREDNMAAMRLSQTCLTKSTEIEYDHGRAYSLRNLTRCYIYQNKSELALQHAQEGVAIFEALRDIEGLAQVVNLMGELYWELGDYPLALTQNVRVSQLAQQAGLRQMEATALNNMAMIYVRLEDYEKVREMFTLTIPIFKELGDESGLLYTLNNMAMLYLTLKQYDTAEMFAQRAINVLDGRQWAVHESLVYDTYGQVLAAQERLAQAEAAFLRSAEVNSGEFKRNLCLTSFHLGQLYARQGRYQEALIQGHAALKIGVQLGNQILQYQTHEVLAETYEAAGNLPNALHHFKQFYALQQTVHNEDKAREMLNLEVRYRTLSARKEAQILRQTNAELQHEIAERMRIESELVEAKNSAERAQVAAEAASRAKSEFLSNMSHELRTPLNGILGYAQILSRSSTLGRDQMEGVKIIQHSGEHLLTLINDILDISKIEARRLELQNGELHVSSFLDGIVGLMQMRAAQKGIDLAFETTGELPKGIWVDEKRLRQVLINLLGNGIKFTERGGVSLRIDSVLNADSSATLRFAVTDTGIGIGAEHLSEIFQPFEQVGNSQQRAAGTGLGLAISQRLVNAMGGEIAVESTLGEGSCFWFDIEVRTTQAQKEVRPFLPPVIGYHGVPQTLLIVDDTTYNRLLLRSLLAPLGFELLEAVDGHEALAMAANHRPDLIFLDIVLPDCNGLDIVPLLRRNAPEAAILAVSASIIDLDRDTIVEAGCDDFLPKPIRIDDLLMLIHQFLDIEWIYESQTRVVEDVTFDIAVDQLPMRPQLDELLELAMIGDVHGVERLALELQQRSSAMYPFTQQVIRLAREFEEEVLTALLQDAVVMLNRQSAAQTVEI